MKPYALYSFKILAYNSKGHGDLSPPVEIRTEEQGKRKMNVENGYCTLLWEILEIISKGMLGSGSIIKINFKANHFYEYPWVYYIIKVPSGRKTSFKNK